MGNANSLVQDLNSGGRVHFYDNNDFATSAFSLSLYRTKCYNEDKE